MPKYKPDVVLLELTFFDPAGIEILENLRQDVVLCKMSIVIHSERAVRKYIIKCAQLGVSGCVVKPASISNVVTKICEVFVKAGQTQLFQAQVDALTVFEKDEENAELVIAFRKKIPHATVKIVTHSYCLD